MTPLFVFLQELAQRDYDTLMFFFGEMDHFDQENRHTVWWALHKTQWRTVQNAFRILSSQCEFETRDYGDQDNFLFRVRWKAIDPIVFNKMLFPLPIDTYPTPCAAAPATWLRASAA